MKPAIVLLRPLGGSVALWGRFRDVLAEHFMVIAPTPESSWSMRALARQAIRALDARRVERAVVYGQSLGGMVAQRVVLMAPNRVERLVLASTAANGAAFMRLTNARFSRCLTKRTGDLEACLAASVLSPAFREAHPARATEIYDRIRDQPTPRTTLVRHALAGATFRSAPSRIACPTLVLAGELDDVLGHAPQLDLARRLRDARFDVVPGAGHDVTLERPIETAHRVIAFAHAKEAGASSRAT